MKTLVHNHVLSVQCDWAECETDRYVDGIHIFKGAVVVTWPLEEKESKDD